jgi:hypothetical protein
MLRLKRLLLELKRARIINVVIKRRELLPRPLNLSKSKSQRRNKINLASPIQILKSKNKYQ